MSGEVTVNIARCHYPVRGLGFGARTGIWLQGCTIHCPGCIVPETWDAGPQDRVTLQALLTSLQPWIEASDGVTISGGEPFEQPAALYTLLAGLRVLSGGDLLVFSGHPWAHLRREHADILDLCDVVISEPYVAREAAPSPLRGSKNQTVHLLTHLGRDRYRNWQDFTREASVARDGEDLRMAGIIARPALVSIARAISSPRRTARLTHGAV